MKSNIGAYLLIGNGIGNVIALLIGSSVGAIQVTSCILVPIFLGIALLK